MQIVKLQIKNFLSISDVEIIAGKVNQIVGGNNNGKTSVLRALEVGLKGVKIDGTLVKNGEELAEIIVEFDDTTTVRRRIKSDGSQTLQVKRDGMVAQKPQSMLDGILATSGFNPLDLLDPKARTENLLKAIDLKVTEQDIRSQIPVSSPFPIPPLDYSQHGLKVVEQAHKYFYQRRAEANRDSETKQNRFTALKNELPPAPVEPSTDRAEIMKQIDQKNIGLSEEGSKKVAWNSAMERVQQGEKKIAELRTTIAEYRAKLTLMEENEIRWQAEIDKIRTDAEQSVPDETSLNKIYEEIRDLQQQLVGIAEFETWKQKEKVVTSAQEDFKKSEHVAMHLNDIVHLLGQNFKTELMKRTELPVEGLTYEDGQFFLDGSSIDNLSTSKAMKLAIAIARKLAGPAKLICIDGAELLDSDSYTTLRREIENDGFTYFISKVGEAFAKHEGDSVTRMENGRAS